MWGCGKWMLLAAAMAAIAVAATGAAAAANKGFKVEYPLKARQMVIGLSGNPAAAAAGAGASSALASQLSSSGHAVPPFFEVARPIVRPSRRRRRPVTCQLIAASFGDSAASGPATARFDAAGCVPRAFDKVVLRWEGRSSGRQFGRISALWLDGVELLRTGTPEFSLERGSWSLEKDITRFSSLFRGGNPARGSSRGQKVTLSLANVIDRVYDGAYTVVVELDFYLTGAKPKPWSPDPTLSPPHLVKPVSLPPNPGGADGNNDGLWFRLGDPLPTSASATVSGIPPNTIRAVLEVCASFHGDDESWFTNPPDDYASANNLSFGHGPFREVAAHLDGRFVGAVWPFPVVYAGGFNPLAWRPALPIATAVVPSFDLEITPFLAQLLAGSSHGFSLSVANALSSWLLDANLLLWIDPAVPATVPASLLAYDVSPFSPSSSGSFSGLDGRFNLSASRSYRFSGSATSSSGTLVTCVSASFAFRSSLVLADDYSYQTAALDISSDSKVTVSRAKSVVASYSKSSSFPLVITCTQVSLHPADNVTSLTCDLAHGFVADESAVSPKGASFSRKLVNEQSASGTLQVDIDGVVVDGTGFVNQTYDFRSSNERCYHRSISTANAAIISDSTSRACNTCTLAIAS